MYEYTRRGWSLSFTLSCIIITAAANPVAQPDAQNLSGRTTTTLQPVIPLTWADPSIIKVADTWYAMGTTDRNEHLPVANSNNLKDWTIVDADAMPKLGKWANAPDSTVNRGNHWTWAPETIQLVSQYYNLSHAGADRFLAKRQICHILQRSDPENDRPTRPALYRCCCRNISDGPLYSLRQQLRLPSRQRWCHRRQWFC